MVIFFKWRRLAHTVNWIFCRNFPFITFICACVRFCVFRSLPENKSDLYHLFYHTMLVSLHKKWIIMWNENDQKQKESEHENNTTHSQRQPKNNNNYNKILYEKNNKRREISAREKWNEWNALVWLWQRLNLRTNCVDAEVNRNSMKNE